MAASPLSRAPAASTAQRGQNATSGSTTQTVSTRPPSTQLQQPVLRLRGAMRGSGERSQRRIQWAEDVIDNEGLGRKSSKVCCIYHPPKASLDESSDESSSDSSDSDSDSGDDGSARPVGGKRRAADRGHKHGHDHDHGDNCNHGTGEPKKSKRSRSPNAYEKVPKPKDGGAKKA